jgi:hypothetical protein
MNLNQENNLFSIYKTVRQLLVGDLDNHNEKENLANMEKRYDNLESEDMNKVIRDTKERNNDSYVEKRVIKYK